MKEAVYTSAPIDATAARVVSKGINYIPGLKQVTHICESKTPLPVSSKDVLRTKGTEVDLTGVRFGRFTVIGPAECFTERKWVVRCLCGTYAHRSARAIKNPKNANDSCRECRHLEHLKDSDFYRRYGTERRDTFKP